MYIFMNKGYSKFASLLRMGMDLLDEPFLSPIVDDSIAIKAGDLNTTIKLAVPGYSKEDVRVTKKENKLLIYLKSDGEEKLAKSYFLTKSIDADSIDVSVKDGILVIAFDKALEAEEEEITIN